MPVGAQPLSEADKAQIFRMATKAFPIRYAIEIETGMSDAELSAALSDILGIFGGSAGPNQPSIAYSGSGLRIWGAWHVVNHVQEKPLFEGAETLAMARLVYGIANPDDRQLSLL